MLKAGGDIITETLMYRDFQGNIGRRSISRRLEDRVYSYTAKEKKPTPLLHQLEKGHTNVNHQQSRPIQHVNLFGKILKVRNVRITNEYVCMQLDTPGNFELMKQILFLIVKCQTRFEISLKSILNKNYTCLLVVPHSILFCTCISRIIVHRGFCKYVPQNKFTIMLKPPCAFMQYVVMNSV